jgi:hypothetical protein
MIETPPAEVESTEEFEMRDADVTRWVDWDENEHISPATVRVKSVGLAIEEEREDQDEVLRRFSQGILGNSSDSPKASNSEDENDSALLPYLDEDSVVQAVSGNGFQIVQEEGPGEPPVIWSSWSTIAEQIRQQEQEKAMLAMIPDWISKGDQHMMDIPGMRPVKWDQFCDVVRLSDDREFAVLEQRRFEQCGALPSPENDVIVGSDLVESSAHFMGVLRPSGKQDHPIATTGTALRWVIKNLPTGSHINLYPETPEVYEALKMANEIVRCTAPFRNGKLMRVKNVRMRECAPWQYWRPRRRWKKGYSFARNSFTPKVIRTCFQRNIESFRAKEDFVVDQPSRGTTWGVF